MSSTTPRNKDQAEKIMLKDHGEERTHRPRCHHQGEVLSVLHIQVQLKEMHPSGFGWRGLSCLGKAQTDARDMGASVCAAILASRLPSGKTFGSVRPVPNNRSCTCKLPED